MSKILNRYFNKHPISWELIHHHILHPSDSVIKCICLHQTPNGLPKHHAKKTNKIPCTICYTEKITTPPKVTTVYINKL